MRERTPLATRDETRFEPGVAARFPIADNQLEVRRTVIGIACRK
jgi:hypothetical protein